MNSKRRLFLPQLIGNNALQMCGFGDSMRKRGFMTMDPADVQAAVAARMADAQRLLCDLVATPSPSGQEKPAMELAADWFAKVGRVERVALTNELRGDPDYCDPMEGLDYTGRYNLRVACGGGKPAGHKSLLLNAHIDAVPPGKAQDRPFEPQVRDGAIYGRGASDAKGQVATAWLAMAALRDLSVEPAGELAAHIVVEEEVGGNGTLAMVRRGDRADACVVLESSELRVFSSVRGSVWFKILCRGRAGHSAAISRTRSAIDMGISVAEILRGYHDRLLASSCGDPLYDGYADPMPLVLGQFHAGNWPATAPDEAVITGLQGFLPASGKTARQVAGEITDAIHAGGPELADNCDIRFTFKHNCSVIDTGHPLVLGLLSAAEAAGKTSWAAGMTSSCDACFYADAGIPTAVFGGGSLKVAHADDEHMPLDELAVAAATLANLAVNWCGS